VSVVIVCSQFLALCRVQGNRGKMILFTLSRMLSSAIALLFIPAFSGGLAATFVLTSLRCLWAARWAGLASLSKAFDKGLRFFFAEGSFTVLYLQKHVGNRQENH
jgi:hypothetical protein